MKQHVKTGYISRFTSSSARQLTARKLQLFSRPQLWFSRRWYLNTIATDGEVRSTKDHVRRRLSTEIFKSCDLTQTELYICIETRNQAGNNTLNFKWPGGRNENTPRATLLQKKADHSASATFSQKKINHYNMIHDYVIHKSVLTQTDNSENKAHAFYSCLLDYLKFGLICTASRYVACTGHSLRNSTQYSVNSTQSTVRSIS